MLTAVRTHDYGRQKIGQLPGILKEEGYDAVQLVLHKAYQEFDSYEGMNEKTLDQIRTSFEKVGMPIHILGCYMDMANPDEDVRRYAVDTFKKCLAYSKVLGAHMVGTETAYPHLSAEEKKIWTPYMYDSIARVVEEAERLDVLMAIEPVYWHPLTDLETVQEVFERMGSDHLKMIFDPGNVLEFPDTTDQDAYWTKWLDAMGSKIEAMHIKDFYEDEKKQYHPVLLGEGVIKYEKIVEWSKKNKPDLVVVREEMNPKTAQRDLAYMRELWK